MSAGQATVDSIATALVALIDERVREALTTTKLQAPEPWPALMKISSAAELLDCSAHTVRRRIDSGELPAVRENGRLMVRGDDLRAYIDTLEAVGKTVTSRYRPRGPRRRVTVKL